MSDEGYAAYGRGTIEPGDRPAVIVVDYQGAFTTANLLDCHRRYAEVTTADACAGYLRRRAAA